MTFTNISSKELNEFLLSDKKDFILVDTRTPREHEKKKIPGTDSLIPFNEIQSRHTELKISPEKDKIILYCRSGNRSAIAAQILANLGYKNLFNLEKGINEFSELYETG